MYVTKLYLQDFRQFEQASWELSSELTLIVAPNGFGKTTLLEALALLATGKSFRAGKTAEMIRFGQEIGRCFALTDEQVRLGATLTGGMVGERRTQQKYFQIDQTKKRQADFVGNLLTVVFRPEDLRLIEGASNRRRDYLDGPLELTSSVYRQARRAYEAALIRRNKTLKAIKEDGLDPGMLHLWDTQLLEHGAIVHQYRRDYIDFVNQNVPFARPYRLIYDHSVVDEARLAKYQTAEIASGHSLIGPHRDDVQIEATFNGETADLAVYGSRGQQRLAVLWLKLAELTYLEQKTGRLPILLLDDIFSELDEQAQALVLEQVGRQTSVITSTDMRVAALLPETRKVIEL